MSSSAWRADHEGIGALGLEAIFLVEAAGAVVFGEHRQVEIVGALVAGALDHPADQLVGDALPLHLLDDIELAELGGFAAWLERQMRRAELHIADQLAVAFGDPNLERRDR